MTVLVQGICPKRPIHHSSYRTFFSNSSIFKVFVRTLANGYHVHANEVSIYLSIYLPNKTAQVLPSRVYSIQDEVNLVCLDQGLLVRMAATFHV